MKMRMSIGKLKPRGPWVRTDGLWKTPVGERVDIEEKCDCPGYTSSTEGLCWDVGPKAHVCTRLKHGPEVEHHSHKSDGVIHSKWGLIEN